MAKTLLNKKYEWRNDGWIFHGSNRGALYLTDTDELIYWNCTLEAAKEYIKTLEV